MRKATQGDSSLAGNPVNCVNNQSTQATQATLKDLAAIQLAALPAPIGNPTLQTLASHVGLFYVTVGQVLAALGNTPVIVIQAQSVVTANE